MTGFIGKITRGWVEEAWVDHIRDRHGWVPGSRVWPVGECSCSTEPKIAGPCDENSDRSHRMGAWSQRGSYWQATCQHCGQTMPVWPFRIERSRMMGRPTPVLSPDSTTPADSL